MKDEIVLPNYDHSILNTITSILKYYDVETKYKSLKKLDEILNKKYRNVVFLILDGLGEHILNYASPDGYFQSKKIDKVTSVYPSTTTAALTTYYSGKPPYETGWIAWSQYFKEYGRAVDMLSHKESYLGENVTNSRINVFETFVNYETIFDKIENSSPDVKTFELVPSYSDKRCKRTICTENLDEIVEMLSILCKVPGRKFILAYSDKPDGLLHKYGVHSNEVTNFIKDAELKIKKLREELDDDTILIITADHGHKDIDKVYKILDYPEINECLIMPISLESRIPTFWVKEDKREEFENRFNKTFGSDFWLMTKQDFLKKGFLGFGEKHPKIDDFLGNYIAPSISGGMIKLETYLSEGKPIKKSTHCGLTKEEMEVSVVIL